MSKHRPSTPRARAVQTNSEGPDASAIRAWARRVFHNTFTRRGKTFRLKRWSFKLQLDGRRQTFSLAAKTRADAAREAKRIHDTILAQGWEAAAQFKNSLRAARVPSLAEEQEKIDLAYWEQRLIQRRYGEARLREGAEYSIRMDYAGAHAYFPLGSEDREQAARKGSEIFKCLLTGGWTAVFEQFEREITLAISWSDSPLAVTYSTLFTFLNTPGVEARSSATDRLNPLVALEPDPTVHSCLSYWLNRQPGFCCRAVCRTLDEVLAELENSRPAMVLMNRVSPDTAQAAKQLQSRWPNLPVFPYRIHEDSDQIFITTSGVGAGYIFRRRLPGAIFDPLRSVARTGMLSQAEVARHIRNYFQSFFGHPDQLVQPALAPVALTNREQEVLTLISRGCPDKEAAHLLDISVWTVHNHLKSIYEKLGVHSRTEAVLKYLQR